MGTRTFLALDLDEPIRRQLIDLQGELDAVGAAVRWTRPELLHVTMKFLGDVRDDDDVSRVCVAATEAAGETEAFEFSVAGVVCAPPRGRTRMVWVGVDDETTHMAELHRRLDGAYAAMGFPRENRQFRPHLTLGRLKGDRRVEPLRQAVAGMASRSFGFQRASELVVYASKLRPQGPIYTPLARASLK